MSNDLPYLDDFVRDVQHNAETKLCAVEGLIEAWRDGGRVNSIRALLKIKKVLETAQ